MFWKKLPTSTKPTKRKRTPQYGRHCTPKLTPFRTRRLNWWQQMSTISSFRRSVRRERTLIPITNQRYMSTIFRRMNSKNGSVWKANASKWSFCACFIPNWKPFMKNSTLVKTTTDARSIKVWCRVCSPRILTGRRRQSGAASIWKVLRITIFSIISSNIMCQTIWLSSSRVILTPTKWWRWQSRILVATNAKTCRRLRLKNKKYWGG